MRALSVMQPWASLLVLGEKRYETRSWVGNVRPSEILLIHASKNQPGWARDVGERDEYCVAALERHGLWYWRLPFGSIVGAVKVRRIVRVEDAVLTPQEAALGDFSPGRFAWEVTDAAAFTERVRCSGRQSLWHVDEALVREHVMPQLHSVGCYHDSSGCI